MNQETGLQLTLVCAAGSFVRTVQTEMGQGKREIDREDQREQKRRCLNSNFLLQTFLKLSNCRCILH